MVSDTGDIPDKDEVAPDRGEASLIQDVLGGGEVDVVLEDGSELELHSYDTYFFSDGLIYTRDDPNDVWFNEDDVIKVVRHYE